MNNKKKSEGPNLPVCSSIDPWLTELQEQIKQL
jgi:hypothetical protein